MDYDISRMRDVVSFIREHRDNADQNSWARVPGPTDPRLQPRHEVLPDRSYASSQGDVSVLSYEASVDELLECGTTACFAGWTCVLNGDTLVNRITNVVSTDEDERPLAMDCRIKGESVMMTIEARAAQLLGLADSEAHEVFCNTENIDDVASTLRDITGEPI